MLKRWISLLTMLAVFLTACLPASVLRLDDVAAPEELAARPSTFVLPAGLRVIEEDAFAMTGAENVILPASLRQIGDGAFGKTDRLKEVYIAGDTSDIADSAFDARGAFTVYGEAGSAAEDWAHRHSRPFEERDIWHPERDLVRMARNPVHRDAAQRQSDETPVRHQTALRATAVDSPPPAERMECHALNWDFP